MKLLVLFVLFFASACSVSAQEVGTSTATSAPSLTQLLVDTGRSAESVLEGIRLRLLDELRVQSQSTEQVRIPSSYVPIVNEVFGGGYTPDADVRTLGTETLACVPFAGSFDIGDSGEEVIQIQRFLNAHSAETRVASEGSGSPGQETSYYGERTFIAVMAFQRMYAEAILAPVGLTAPTGFWGASTRAHAGRLRTCGSAEARLVPNGMGL